jgi:hypothetical protein
VSFQFLAVAAGQLVKREERQIVSELFVCLHKLLKKLTSRTAGAKAPL